jgi:hypothetical protein
MASTVKEIIKTVRDNKRAIKRYGKQGVKTQEGVYQLLREVHKLKEDKKRRDDDLMFFGDGRGANDEGYSKPFMSSRNRALMLASDRYNDHWHQSMGSSNKKDTEALASLNKKFDSLRSDIKKMSKGTHTMGDFNKMSTRERIEAIEADNIGIQKAATMILARLAQLDPGADEERFYKRWTGNNRPNAYAFTSKPEFKNYQAILTSCGTRLDAIRKLASAEMVAGSPPDIPKSTFLYYMHLAQLFNERGKKVNDLLDSLLPRSKKPWTFNDKFAAHQLCNGEKMPKSVEAWLESGVNPNNREDADGKLILWTDKSVLCQLSDLVEAAEAADKGERRSELSEKAQRVFNDGLSLGRGFKVAFVEEGYVCIGIETAEKPKSEEEKKADAAAARIAATVTAGSRTPGARTPGAAAAFGAADAVSPGMDYVDAIRLFAYAAGAVLLVFTAAAGINAGLNGIGDALNTANAYVDHAYGGVADVALAIGGLQIGNRMSSGIRNIAAMAAYLPSWERFSESDKATFADALNSNLTDINGTLGTMTPDEVSTWLGSLGWGTISVGGPLIATSTLRHVASWITKDSASYPSIVNIAKYTGGTVLGALITIFAAGSTTE